jgi:hypothetical protein
MVFISVSTHPGSWRLAAFRPVFGSVFAFRPLNEEYCIPDTVYTTSAFVRSRRNFFFRQMETTQQSCCNAAKRAHECAPRASPAGWASGPETPTYPIDLREIQPRPKPDLTTSIEVSLGVDPSGDFAALLNLKQYCVDVRAFEIRILASSIEKQLVLDAFMQI